MKKMPTILALFLLVIVIGAVIGFIEHMTKLQSQLSQLKPPKNVQFTNISDSSFTIVWQTEEQTTGEISLTDDTGNRVKLIDDRDREDKQPKKYMVHSVTAHNLNPSTTYALEILLNGKKFRNGTVPFQVQTAITLMKPSSNLKPVFGTVFTQMNVPAAEALVLFTTENSQLLSTIVKPSGSFIIPLNTMRTQNLQSLVTPKGSPAMRLTILSDSDAATVTTNSENIAPIPPIVLGKSYDFRKNKPVALDRNAQKSVLGMQSSRPQKNTFTVSIVSPAQGAHLPTNLPLFQGTGIPEKSVIVTIGITKPVSVSTHVGGDGIWRVTPPKPLNIGKQSVTITTVNVKGKPVALTHMFDVLKSGTQVLGDATPSATLTPTETPEVTIEPTETPQATIAPSLTPEPTTAPIEGKPVPVSGTIESTIILLVLGIMLIGAGGFLVIR